MNKFLFEAVARGATEEIKQLIRGGINLEMKDENGSSPLIRASAVGDIPIMRLLLDHGADIEHQNDAQQSSLVAAFTKGQRVAARLLIASGADQTYALEHLIATKNVPALKLFSEECSAGIKAAYIYSGSERDGCKDGVDCKIISDLLRIVETEANAGDETYPEDSNSLFRKKRILNCLGKHSNNSHEQVLFLRYFLKNYPFFEFMHITLGEAMLNDGTAEGVDEALFHLEIAYSMNQLNLYTHSLLDRAYRKKQNPTAVISDFELQKRFCSRPFERFISNVDSHVYVCCPSWLPRPIGNINTQSWEEIWDSESAQEIRRSVIDGDYKYCSRLLCPRIQDGSLPEKKDIKEPFFREILDNRKVLLASYPREYVLGHDLSCNYACPSCRTKKFTANAEEQKRLSTIKERVVMPILKRVKYLMLSGSGEFIASSHCREILQSINSRDYPGLRLVMLTNGMLFTEKVWFEFSALAEMIREIHVSIDAVDASTYQKLRKGGDFQSLMINLQFFSNLRQKKRIDKFLINMVVQKANYLEMKKFVEMGKTLGCDQVTFSRITNWGCFAPDRFRGIDIASPSHPEHEEFLATLRDPLFKDKIVDLYNIYRFWKEANRKGRMVEKHEGVGKEK
ncbi:MAG: hypothetical protein A3G33_05290 [Omnitrophica bacterium RIFCSPLOWO2_12_FULL_44_17]|uniref:4Fe4S-binding SPASM domain-containing protein n=1 Tax=Candidatus Danuiimicrobium aquiferis TaxID=1801832 RepID=A0A1G1KQ88_9BACT|nr:MAG: hypothetical protein A3B72_04995 [Omnitrophica bacterium RIFCSPHIGHO2_02_FULL_45_28]OGW95048.1 MAG: hypothetical protein A3G33_05290 [Omnitrophica bacterium RIFCSPLOWO2_12_FULL_44_17]OGX02968.1 MAG: hypothetical protein A3J12_01515 [Omnitrophica bacterium RIFCSPLOWO2_02_FULL_44_11]